MMPSPLSFDRAWSVLTLVSSARGQRDRWPIEEDLLTLPDGDGEVMIAVAMTALQVRLQRMCDGNPTENQLWLIAGLLEHQLLLPEGYTRAHLYRLLTAIASHDEAAVTSPDVVALLELVWGLKLPADPEGAREQSLRRWRHDNITSGADFTGEDFVMLILGSLDRACPEDWISFEGTVTMATGQLLANLSVTTPAESEAVFTTLILMPDLIGYREAHGLSWLGHIEASDTGAELAVMNRNTTPHPSQLLRISDFYAELPPGPLAEDTPGWLRSYLTDGTIDYGSGQRPVAGPAEALDIVRRKAAERGLGPRFNTRMLVAVRLPVGYRVFMYQPPDTPFDQLIVGSPRFYVGDDCRIYPTRAGLPAHSDEEFRVAFEQRHGYDSTTGDPWVRPAAIIGPRKPD
ncbi:hypothetical protein HGA05_21080 [Gordonia polyisoprenivorans]|uniref:Uncharacterized protein n=2 Tax=Gordonia polyisoprenivorans TaxID=84595 RepID=A0A846WSD0_9ACTN|nr:hypothetical protein [Gordonia polyisoprenivorans]